MSLSLNPSQNQYQPTLRRRAQSRHPARKNRRHSQNRRRMQSRRPGRPMMSASPPWFRPTPFSDCPSAAIPWSRRRPPTAPESPNTIPIKWRIWARNCASSRPARRSRSISPCNISSKICAEARQGHTQARHTTEENPIVPVSLFASQISCQAERTERGKLLHRAACSAPIRLVTH
jgi:hypothetical protein